MSSKSPEDTDTNNPKRSRGRPRDPGAAEAIREATTELLAEQGYHGFTMSGVAKRAGVAKTTIYRRWPSKAEMVLDAVAEQALTPGTIDRSDDPIADLRELIVQFYQRVSGRNTQDVPIAPSELLREAEVAELFRERFVDPMREHAIKLVEQAIEQKRIHQDLDPAMLVDALAAPAIYQPVALGSRTASDAAGRIFELVMHGALQN